MAVQENLENRGFIPLYSQEGTTVTPAPKGIAALDQDPSRPPIGPTLHMAGQRTAITPTDTLKLETSASAETPRP